MTQEEIIEIIMQIGGCDRPEDNSPALKMFVTFANLVAAKATEEANAKANASWTLMCKKMVAIEREACAQVCDSFYLSWIDIQGRYKFMGEGASECAGAIRARGEQA